MWVGTVLPVCLMVILSYGFPQVRFSQKSEVILLFTDFISLANYYYGLYPRYLIIQFTKLSGFMYLHPKLGCSCIFQTAKYTSNCTMWCIFDVNIPQCSKQSFPLSLPFKTIPKTHLMNHAVHNMNGSFLLHTLRKCIHNLFLLCNTDLGWGAYSSQGVFPLSSHFELSYYNKGSSFLWNQDMLVMILERKHILTSVLHRDKVDIFTESTRKKI